MPVAVPVQLSHAPQLQPGMGPALGVEFDHLHPVRGDEGQEGDEVGLLHGVANGDEMLVLHMFDGDGVVIVGFLGLQRRQYQAAAADYRAADGVEDVAADGADEKTAPEEIGRDVAVGDGFAVHQLNDADAQGPGQGLQQGDVRQSPGGFPLGDGLAADAQLFRQLRLGHAPRLPELPDGGAGHIGVHGQHFLSPEAYHGGTAEATCAA